MKTFKQYVENRGYILRYGSRPAIALNVQRPGLGFVFDKKGYDEFGAPSSSRYELSFVGKVEIPFTDLAKKMAAEKSQDLKTFIYEIAQGMGGDNADVYDEPEKLVSFDHADFVGLDSDVDPVPESLYETLYEEFWRIVKSGRFTIEN